MKIATIFLTAFLILTLNLFAATNANSKSSTSLAQIIHECDSTALKQQKTSDVQFAEKLKQKKEYYKTSIDKNWNSRNPIIDSLRQSFAGCMTIAQRASYNVFMIEMFNDISISDLGLSVGKYSDLPVSQWSREHITDAVTDKVNKLFADKEALRQLDATPYINLFNSEPLNQFDNLYQLLLTTAADYCVIFFQKKLMDSLFVELNEETKENASLQINTFLQNYEWKRRDSLYLPKIEELMTKFPDDNAVVQLARMRLHHLFYNPSKDNQASSSYYEQLLTDCDAAIKRFDDSKYLSNIRRMRAEILVKKSRIISPRQVYPNTPFTIDITQQNYTDLEIVAYRVEGDLYTRIDSLASQEFYFIGGYMSLLPENYERIDKLLSSKSDIVFRELLEFDTRLYVKQKREIEFSVKDIGNYLVVCRNDENEIISVSVFCASHVAPVSVNHNGAFYLYATDFKSGKPIKHLDVDIYNDKISDSSHALTKKLNFDGFVKVLENGEIKGRSFVAKVIDGEDNYAPMISDHLSSLRQVDTLDVSIFTDRKRYMLGDTICFRGYLYSPGKNVVPNSKLTYLFMNPKWEEITSLTNEVTTDDWGGFDGKFAVPSNWLAGRYTIYTQYGSISINVGDYKPPTIEIQMVTDRVDYSLGDSVKVNGVVTSYAGFPIANAKVSYVVTRSGRYFFSHIEEKNILASKTTVNADGEFDFSFSLEPQQGKENEDYTYTIAASVTTLTGEVQLHEKKLSVEVNRYQLEVNAPHVVNKDTGYDIVVSALDMYQDKRDGVEGNYKVVSGDSEVLSGQFVTGTPIAVPWKMLKNGDHKFTFKVDKAEEVFRDMFVYSASDKIVPVDTVLFFNVINPNFSVNSPLKFVLGSSEKKVYTLVELYDNQKKWYSKLYVTKNRMEQHTIPYNKEFPNHLKLMNTTIYEGELYRGSDDVMRQIKKKEIILKLKSIREIASPGTQESLSFEVQDKETGEGVEADILVSIYDKSTDKPIENIYKPFDDGTSEQINRISCYSPSTPFSGEIVVVDYGSQTEKKLVGSVGSTIEQTMSDKKTKPLQSDSPIEERENFNQTPLQSDLPIKMRDNFNQTALFAVRVRTDSMGFAEVNYKLPDAIRAYSIKAFATLKNTTSAVASSEFVASKEVIIMPNLPQFFRFGDEVTLRANAINLTDKTIDAKVRMETFDVRSKKVIKSSEKNISIAPNSSEVVTWSLPAVEINSEVVGVRFIIDSPNHTDSEERIMPILPANERLVKGRSYFLCDDNSEININVKEMLVDSASSEILYVTSGSPSMMLLNTISNFDVDSEPISVIDYASRLHAYGLGSQIAYQYRDIIASMAKRKSSTSKHEEQYGDILDISRGEIPWDKKVKFTNIDFLQSLLNKEANSDEIRDCASVISASKNRDGGLGWFKGMPSSFTVSAYFLDRYIALSEVQFYNDKVKDLYAKVATYLDNYIVARYNECVASDDKPELDGTVAYYLYVRSGLPLVKLDDKAQKVRDYYLKLVADGGWQKLSIMDKAYIAMALKKMDVDNAQILENLSKYAVKNKTLGNYFPNAVLPLRGSIYCEVSAHSLLLRLYSRNETYADLTNGLAQWIMLQRKNQTWSANVATLDATWALLEYYQSIGVANRNSEMVVSSTAKMGTPMAFGDLISVPKVKSDSKAEVLTVKKIGSEPLFVDIMYSYKLPLKHIKRADNGFNITRKLYRFIDGEYVEVDEGTVFNIGDQVLAKYYIQNSENRSYVRIKALRSGALEPINNSSGYKDGYYREVRESHNNYFFYLMPEGATTIDEHFTVWYSGKFSDGFVGVQSLYEPASNGNTTTYTMEINTSIDVE